MPSVSTPNAFAKGDVVLVTYPFADLSGTKVRPAVVVCAIPPQTEITLAFVTSQNVGTLQPGDIAVLPTHPEFNQTGLTAPSKVRATKLATLHRALITRRLGRCGSNLLMGIDNALVSGLNINTQSYEQKGVQNERVRLVSLGRAQGAEATLTDLGISIP